MGRCKGFRTGRRLTRIAALMAIAALGIAGCTSSDLSTSTTSAAVGSSVSRVGSTTTGVATIGRTGRPSASITVFPANALIDQPVAISIKGLVPGTQVTVTARATDRAGVGWMSDAQISAGATGVATLDEPSAGGSSYRGVNPMGLFENMTPIKGSAISFVNPPNGYSVTLTASVAGVVVAHTSTQRLGGASANVIATQQTPANTGIFGDLFMPKTLSPGRPAVMLLGGSEGGLSTELLASTLAAHGYPTLALAYFAEPGLPSTLANIPLEYFTEGLHLLAAQPGIDKGKVMVFGVSRGSEAALLLGVHFPNLVHGVIVGSPSSLIFGSLSTSAAAWTFEGKPLAFATIQDFHSGTTTPADASDSVIPVEKIKGPIVTFCGEIDALWHSCDYSGAITARLQAKQVSYPRASFSYPDAGHLVGCLCSYVSFTTTGNYGGTINANAMAQATANQQLLGWLSKQ